MRKLLVLVMALVMSFGVWGDAHAAEVLRQRVNVRTAVNYEGGKGYVEITRRVYDGHELKRTYVTTIEFTSSSGEPVDTVLIDGFRR